MKLQAHLCLEELVVPPTEEWAATLGGWYFLRLSQGQAYWLAESAALDLGLGQVVVLSPARMGLLRASQLGVARIHHFRFCPEYLVGLLTLAERQHLDKMSLKPRLIPQQFAPDHPAARLFAEICQSTIKVDALELRAQLLRVVAHCFDWGTPSRGELESMVLPASKRLQVTVSQLSEAELCELPASALAAKCGCSVQHLNRLFQNHYGISLRVRQAELRLIRARQLLLETSDSIRDIARAVGARHLSYFNAQFKKEFGLSPAEFRRQRSRDRLTDAVTGKLVA